MNQKERSSSFFDFGKKEGIFDKEKENNFSNLMFPTDKEQTNNLENFNILNFQRDNDLKNFKSEKKPYKNNGIS